MVAKSDGSGIALYDINPATGKRSLLVYCASKDKKSGKSNWKECRYHKHLSEKREVDTVAADAGQDLASFVEQDGANTQTLEDYYNSTEEVEQDEVPEPNVADNTKGKATSLGDAISYRAERVGMSTENWLLTSGAKDITSAIDEIGTAFQKDLFYGKMSSKGVRKFGSWVGKKLRGPVSESDRALREHEQNYKRRPEKATENARKANEEYIAEYKRKMIEKVDAKLNELDATVARMDAKINSIDSNVATLNSQKQQLEAKKQEVLSGASHAKGIATINREIAQVDAKILELTNTRGQLSGPSILGPDGKPMGNSPEKVDAKIQDLRNKKSSLEAKKQSINSDAEQKKAAQLSVINRGIMKINESLREYSGSKKKLTDRKRQLVVVRRNLVERKRTIATKTPTGLKLPFPNVDMNRKKGSAGKVSNIYAQSNANRRTA